jgi:hypothetical protein
MPTDHTMGPDSGLPTAGESACAPCGRVVVSPLHCFKRVLLREHVSHFSDNAIVVLCAVGPDTSESGTPPRKRTVARVVKRAPSAEQEPPQEAPDLDAGGLP